MRALLRAALLALVIATSPDAGFAGPQPPEFPAATEASGRGLDDAAGSASYPLSQCAPSNLGVALADGALCVDVTPPQYRSLNVSRGLSFVYRSDRAYPVPVIPFNVAIPATASVPPLLSYTVAIGGSTSSAVFIDTSGLAEGAENTIRAAVSAEARHLETGAYSFRVTATSHYASGSLSGELVGRVLVANGQRSPIGAGWGIVNLSRIRRTNDGLVILTSGDGMMLVFAGGPVTYTSPPGDFSTLVRRADGGFTRTLRDQTVIAFNTHGRQASVTDRNGNSTRFAYDDDARLISITDPVGLRTILNYREGLLLSVADPAGRTTRFEHGRHRNLTRVTFPDGTQRSFTYDSRHLMVAETDQRGLTVRREFDDVGRLGTITFPDGATQRVQYAHGVGLVDRATGLGTSTHPAPVTLPADAFGVLTDGRGNQTTVDVRRLAAIVAISDPLGRTSLIDRDANGNPTRITRANGAAVSMTYDAVGNLLTRAEESTGATTRLLICA
jgi:YD repeat-containing protein